MSISPTHGKEMMPFEVAGDESGSRNQNVSMSVEKASKRRTTNLDNVEVKGFLKPV